MTRPALSLFAEDFTAPPPPAPAPDPLPAAEPAPPPLGQADIDRAVAEAVEQARSTWAREAQHARAAALRDTAAALGELRAEGARQAEATALALSRAALGMLAGALPGLCRAHGDAEVRTLLRHVLPRIAAPMRPVVRVHAGLIQSLQDDLAQLDPALLEHVTFRPANLPPGDVRLSWEDGGMVRDCDELCGAIRDGLAELGLMPATLTREDIDGQ